MQDRARQNIIINKLKELHREGLADRAPSADVINIVSNWLQNTGEKEIANMDYFEFNHAVEELLMELNDSSEIDIIEAFLFGN